MKSWAWILPCWVWKYFFAQFPRERVLLDGRTLFLVRLDGEFALVYDRQTQIDKPEKTCVSMWVGLLTNEISPQTTVQSENANERSDSNRRFRQKQNVVVIQVPRRGLF